MDIYVVKGKRVGKIHDIAHKNSIYVTKITRKERVKVWMGKPKGLMHVLWKRVFMDTSKGVCNYYTLRGKLDVRYYYSLFPT